MYSCLLFVFKSMFSLTFHEMDHPYCPACKFFTRSFLLKDIDFFKKFFPSNLEHAFLRHAGMQEVSRQNV